MSFLENLLADDKRQDYDDFIRRYDQGEPWDSISDDEAVSRYSEIAGQLSDEDYRSSAQEALRPPHAPATLTLLEAEQSEQQAS
jgi:hypothetical protein